MFCKTHRSAVQCGFTVLLQTRMWLRIMRREFAADAVFSARPHRKNVWNGAHFDSRIPQTEGEIHIESQFWRFWSLLLCGEIRPQFHGSGRWSCTLFGIVIQRWWKNILRCGMERFTNSCYLWCGFGFESRFVVWAKLSQCQQFWTAQNTNVPIPFVWPRICELGVLKILRGGKVTCIIDITCIPGRT